jgi:hypothetical protein
MNNEEKEFLSQFENGTLPAEKFHHADHVRAAWIYVRNYSAMEGLQRFCTHLKQFALRHGKPGLYHETITWAYFLLIQERAKKEDHDCWEKFVENNADLFDWKNSILKQYYTQETLQSSLARSIFVLPDARYQMPDARDTQIPEQR